MKTFITKQSLIILIIGLSIASSARSQQQKETLLAPTPQAAQKQTSTQTSTPAPLTTQATVSYPREAYQSVPVNIGFVPPLTITNIVQASTGKRVITNVSFNMFGGSGNALEGVEMASIWNYQSDYVRGIQGAGIVNIVGGDAGFVQGAGIGNIVGGKFEGAQGAGIFNIASNGLSGVQGAGIFNTTGDADAVQGAGIFNRAGNIKGVQGAGIFNAAKNITGVQAAGIFNTAENVDGAQVAGIFNSAKHVKGAQIGLINIAEDNEDVMIGLLNFSAKHGIRIELYTDEMLFIRAGLRTGNKAWYSLLTGGLQPFNGITIWSLGYGGGTQLYLGQNDYFDFSLHTESMFNGAIGRNNFFYGQAGRLRVMFGHDFSPRFSVFLGPTLNVMVGADNNLYELTNNLFRGSGYLFEVNNGRFWNGVDNAWVRGWIGLTGGFRF